MNNNLYTLITGGSEGLGKGLALECARRRMNLILVALPGPEIFSLAALIKRNYPVDVICIEKDLCKDESCTEVFNEVSRMNVQVNILINNAGTGSTIFFNEGSIYLYEKQIKLNVLATTLLTRLFLEMLRSNRDSYILNVGSMASYFCLPKKNVYAATKSFVYAFSKSLSKELKKDNIHVSVLCPGCMNTNLPLTLMYKTGNYLSRLSVMNPEDAAPLALTGMLKKKGVIIPGRLNRFFLILDKILPEFIKTWITNYTMERMSPQNRYIKYLPTPCRIPAIAKVA